MTLSSFLRVSGLCAMIGGLLFLSTPIWVLGFPDTMINAYVDHLGTILILLGLVGCYLSQIKSTGKFGLISFLIAFLGTSMWIGFKWASSFIVPVLKDVAPQMIDEMPATIMIGMMISLYTFLIGWILFSIVTARKAVLPRWGAILIIIGLISDVIPYGYYVAQPLAGLGIAWLGYALWQGRKENETLE